MRGKKEQVSGLKEFAAPAQEWVENPFGSGEEMQGRLHLALLLVLWEGDPASRHCRVKQLSWLVTQKYDLSGGKPEFYSLNIGRDILELQYSPGRVLGKCHCW